jgi:hypothetical protein
MQKLHSCDMHRINKALTRLISVFTLLCLT